MHSHLLVLTTPFTSTRFPTSLPLALDDCMFHTFRRIPVWEYQTDQQLLKGLLDALAAHKALCDEGVLHGRINPETVFLVGAVAGSEQGAAGFLDATHIDEDAVAASRSAAAVNDTVRASSPVSYIAVQRELKILYVGRGPAAVRVAPPLMAHRPRPHPGPEKRRGRRGVLLLGPALRRAQEPRRQYGRPRGPHRKLIRTSFLTTFGGTSATEILDGRDTGLTTIRRHKLLGKRVPAENISHAPWVLLWRYNQHLRDTDVEDEMPTLEADVSGEDGLEDGSDTEVVARVLNHDKLMNNLRVAAAGGLLTDEMSAGG